MNNVYAIAALAAVLLLQGCGNSQPEETTSIETASPVQETSVPVPPVPVAPPRLVALEDISVEDAIRLAVYENNSSMALRLGDKYRGGIGVDRDRGLAEHWYSVAQENGHPEAAARLSEMKSYMDVEEMEGVAVAEARRRREGAVWVYQTTDDDLTGGKGKRASVTSDSFSLSSPFDGSQQATLTVRKHPRWGTGVHLSIERGAFSCLGMDCEILARFDGGEVLTFSASGAESGDPTILFFDNASRFLTLLKKSKKVQLAVNILNHGEITLEFVTTGLEWDQKASLVTSANSNMTKRTWNPYTSQASCIQLGNSVEHCYSYFPNAATN